MLEATRNRIGAIDALRGCALFGILIVNVLVFHAPLSYFGEFYGPFDGTDGFVIWIITGFFVGKSMFLFAFLFGWGAHLQFKRFAEFGAFRSFWFRRMGWLALAGALHLLLYWMGDILLPYAILGLSLPWLLRAKTAWLVVIGLLVYFSPALYVLGEALLGLPGAHPKQFHNLQFYIESYSTKGYFELLPIRLEEFWSYGNDKLVNYIPKEFSLFLMGIVAGRMRINEWVSRNLLVGGAAVFLTAGVIWFWIEFFPVVRSALDLKAHPENGSILYLLHLLYEFIHGLGYVFLILTLWELNPVRWVLHAFRYAGRMAFTNYILQSTICVIVFYGYGFGQYGQWRPVHLAAFASGVFAVQLLLSYLWLQRFKQGPLEHLWRRLSYGKGSS